MNKPYQLEAFAFLCDSRGIISDILYHSPGLFAGSCVGDSWLQWVDAADRIKAAEFLHALIDSPVVANWQINTSTDRQVEPLHFAGGALDGLFLVSGARRRDDLAGLYRLFLAQEDARSAKLRPILEEITKQNWLSAGKEEAWLDQLSLLNNELADMQRELAKKNAELERLNQLKNQFLGMAAHDLRNPIGVIMLYSEFIQREMAGRMSVEENEFVAIIHQKSEFMLRLINDLLDISRIEAGRLDLDMQLSDLKSLIEHNVSLNRILASGKKVAIELNANCDLPRMMIDATKIEQVLDNLIGNAIKYSPPESTIQVDLSERPEQIVIAVHDQGVGIAPGDQEKLFRPFSRLAAQGTGGEKSTGLGLVICRRIIEGHHGKIWVESEPGKGSTFSIVLPITRSDVGVKPK
jgi:signal transduction histidine kinase